MQAGPHKMAAVTIQREQHTPKKVCNEKLRGEKKTTIKFHQENAGE